LEAVKEGIMKAGLWEAAQKLKFHAKVAQNLETYTNYLEDLEEELEYEDVRLECLDGVQD